MDSYVPAFAQSLFVFLVSATISKLPRPIGKQIHAYLVFELLRFYFLFIGESVTEHEYIIRFKDDFSGYVSFRECKNEDYATTAETLMEYFTTFYCTSVVF